MTCDNFGGMSPAGGNINSLRFHELQQARMRELQKIKDMKQPENSNCEQQKTGGANQQVMQKWDDFIAKLKKAPEKAKEEADEVAEPDAKTEMEKTDTPKEQSSSKIIGKPWFKNGAIVISNEYKEALKEEIKNTFGGGGA